MKNQLSATPTVTATPEQHSSHSEQISNTERKQRKGVVPFNVMDDSMAPEFLKGDVIYVDPNRQPVDGSYVVALFSCDAEEGTHRIFRQLVIAGTEKYLRPLNGRNQTVNISRGGWAIWGVVVEMSRRPGVVQVIFAERGLRHD
jgi:SOS-response transcriptional repressor LexA